MPVPPRPGAPMRGDWCANVTQQDMREWAVFHLFPRLHNVLSRGDLLDLEPLRDFLEADGIDTLKNEQFLDKKEGAVGGVKLRRRRLAGVLDPRVFHALGGSWALRGIHHQRL